MLTHGMVSTPPPPREWCRPVEFGRRNVIRVFSESEIMCLSNTRFKRGKEEVTNNNG